MKGHNPARAFLWHGFFLALTMAMIEPNTVLPGLIGKLSTNTVVFGALYSILIGAPLVFNLPFSRLQQRFRKPQLFLILGLNLRVLVFLALAGLMWWNGAESRVADSSMTIGILALLLLVFSMAGGFAGIAYTDLIGTLVSPEKRPDLYARRQVLAGIASLLGAALLTWLFRPGALPYPANYSIALLVGSAGLFIRGLGFLGIRDMNQTEDPQPSKVLAAPAPASSTLGILKSDHKFRQVIIVENLSGFSLMLLPFYLVYMVSKVPEANSFMGIYLAAQALGAISSNFLWAALARRLNPKAVIALCIGLGGLIPLLALVLAPLGAAPYALVFVAIGFVLSARNIGFEPYVLSLAPADQRTLYLGIRGSLSILMALLPLAGGAILAFIGYEPTFALASGILLLTALVFSGLLPSQKP